MSTEIAVVLDASALRAYAEGGVAVGELIAEVSDERRLVGVPVVCLAAANAAADGLASALLMLLTNAPTVEVLHSGTDDVPPADEARQVGSLARRIGGDVVAGYAARAAIAYEAHYVTAEAERVAAALPKGWSILDVA